MQKSREMQVDPWVGKIPLRRKWQPTPVFLPWKSHGRRSLVQATIHGVTKRWAWLSDYHYNWPFSPPSTAAAKSLQSCPTLCYPMDSRLPGSNFHGIFKARILEWAAISFSRGSSQPRDRTWVSCIAGRLFTIWATREAHANLKNSLKFQFPYVTR